MFKSVKSFTEIATRLVFFHLFKFDIELCTISTVYGVYIFNLERKNSVRQFIRFESVVFAQSFCFEMRGL